MNYRQAWAEGDIEAGTLLDAIEELQKEVEFLKDRLTIRAAEHMEDLVLLIEVEIEGERLRDILLEVQKDSGFANLYEQLQDQIDKELTIVVGES